MRNAIVIHAFLIVAALSLALTCAAQTISTVPEGVERYARDINAVMNSSGTVSLEKAFEEGLLAAEALKPDMERLAEPTFQKVKRLMAGFIVNRDEVIFAEPDANFLLKMAREKGTKADQAFFETLAKTYTEGIWAAYIIPKTDWGGCMVFGGKTLSGTYGFWISYQKAHPDLYQGAVRKELALIQSALESECVCGGEDEYRKELQGFLKTYPASPFASGVASRLEALNKKPSRSGFIACHGDGLNGRFTNANRTDWSRIGGKSCRSLYLVVA
jgi:hypothetical protein